jgi:hypothetical protein
MMMIFGFERRRRIGILLGFIKYLKIRNFYLYEELEIKNGVIWSFGHGVRVYGVVLLLWRGKEKRRESLTLFLEDKNE